jgi:cell division protease FtsH
MSEKEREIVAVHEMGHALVALSVPNADPVHRVTIIPRGAGALGMTMQRPLEDRYLMTEPELDDRLAILLGGRTAEELAFGQVSTGAQNDLERATEIARAMVVEYGMSDKLGPLSFGHNGFRSADGRMLFPGERPEMSEDTARIVDQEVSRIVGEARDRARGILEDRKAFLDRLAELLMVREVLEGKELKEFVDGSRQIPSIEDEKQRLTEAAEREEEVERARKAELARTPPAAAPVTEEVPPAPHLHQPTEELGRR